MFLRFLLPVLIFAGCDSPKYKAAYDAAKKLGRFDLYAEALAQKYDEGRDLSYAVQYAIAMNNLQGSVVGYTDEEKKTFAELYAEKKQEGKNAVELPHLVEYLGLGFQACD